LATKPKIKIEAAEISAASNLWRFPVEEKGKYFESTVPWSEGETESLVIHCSDHHYQAHFEEFIEKGLKLKSPVRLSLPGGPQPLIAAGVLPKFEWAGRRWTKFLVKTHSVKEIICIAHLDCAWYKNITVGGLNLLQLKEKQIDDLRQIREVLKEMLPRVDVQMFFAQPSPRGHVEFTEVH
jgi:hypothetical protein